MANKTREEKIAKARSVSKSEITRNTTFVGICAKILGEHRALEFLNEQELIASRVVVRTAILDMADFFQNHLTEVIINII